MIADMSLTPGTHQLGPGDGTLELHTFREGVAQKVGHDLIIVVTDWSATATVDDEGSLTSVALEVDSRSLEVREGHNGLKPLSDKDRNDIRKTIDNKVLLGQPVKFHSDAVETTGGLTVRGALTIVGTERPTSFELTMSDDGQVRGKLPVTQTEFGIKPYKGLMGALKVRDEVQLVLDVRLPAS
jgi:polyisoprenoid-binding protein YceI